VRVSAAPFRSGIIRGPRETAPREGEAKNALDQSVANIPDGASLMIGGFMAVGTPERIIDEIVRQKKRDLL
jgi:Coenzyme A transferase